MWRYARGHVIRPIRIFGALAIAGGAAAALTFVGFPVPSNFLAMNACVALAFALNRRPIGRSTRPTWSRGLWFAFVALMISRIGSAARFAVAGSGGIGAVSVGLGVVELLPIVIALAYVVRGIAADPRDRLLIGALAGLLSPRVVDAILVTWLGFGALELDAPAWWSYPSWLLLGAALARANGNLRRP